MAVYTTPGWPVCELHWHPVSHCLHNLTPLLHSMLTGRLTYKLECGVMHLLWHWCVVGLEVVGVEGADVHKGAQAGHLAGKGQQLPGATVVGPAQVVTAEHSNKVKQ